MNFISKLSSILSILSFLISLTTIGAGYAGYKWIRSGNFEKMMMEKVMDQVGTLIPSIPSTTTPPLFETPKKLNF